MKTLFIMSMEPYSGKSAVCLAIGKRLQSDGYKVGYLKPISTQTWRTAEGTLVDEDAAFVQRTLNLNEDPITLSPVLITPSALRKRLSSSPGKDPLDKIRKTIENVGRDKDVLLLEGGASLQEGCAMGISNLRLTRELGISALVVIKYRYENQLIDDALDARDRLGKQFLGVIINQIPNEEHDFVKNYAYPYLEREGIRIHGMLPTKPRLSAISVNELISSLHAEVLTKNVDPGVLIYNFAVGAMTLEAALSHFRRQQNKAVITGGDRADIQFAALDTSTAALILTGNLHPSSLVIKQAEALNVPILLVKENTMSTINTIEKVYGKTRLGQPEKLEAFMSLMQENKVFDAIYKSLELD